MAGFGEAVDVSMMESSPTARLAADEAADAHYLRINEVGKHGRRGGGRPAGPEP